MKYLVRTILIMVIILITVSGFHAHRVTHFHEIGPTETNGDNLLKSFFFGVKVPRPENNRTPKLPYETVSLGNDNKIECWEIKADSSNKAIIIFHGYTSKKSDMLKKAYFFVKLGYNVFMPDFMGSGGSFGNKSTIGVKEAEQVKLCVDYIKTHNPSELILVGTSMGAAAIMKAINDYNIEADKLILECPFGSMRKSFRNHIRIKNLPAFAFTDFIMIWNNMYHGINMYAHRPVTYAKNINIESLLIYGVNDRRVTRKETDQIFKNLNGKKELLILKNSAHANYLKKDKEKWLESVAIFLE
ncbi:MAG: alpha/beta hydrolase [Bacteroidales bacterium]|nr:alpha/beta hydrolase [Bacteroidales bacterium]